MQKAIKSSAGRQPVTVLPGLADAHAGLTDANPPPGATLGASPTEIDLTFSEQPVAALSTIAILDRRGQRLQSGRPTAAGADPLTLSIPVRPLARGVYTVRWRVDSAVDGPGLRLVAWTTACMFRCQFCHNPDTWTLSNGIPVPLERAVQVIRKYANGLKQMNATEIRPKRVRNMYLGIRALPQQKVRNA